MAKPLIAIVGRPNVGKSMLFNRLAGQRLSIVEDTPGVTRDRLYASSDWVGHEFAIVDTGGIEPTTDNEILLFMREQALLAIEMSDVILFVTDITTGCHGGRPGNCQYAAEVAQAGGPGGQQDGLRRADESRYL